MIDPTRRLARILTILQAHHGRARRLPTRRVVALHRAARTAGTRSLRASLSRFGEWIGHGIGVRENLAAAQEIAEASRLIQRLLAH
jgi:hypothetical protein